MRIDESEGCKMNRLELGELIKQADKVLIGIGGEFAVTEQILEKVEAFRRYKKETTTKMDWLLPYIMKLADQENATERINEAYHNLLRLLENNETNKKIDYFIISTCMEDTILRAGFDENRIVMPCGDFTNYKCVCNCQNKIWRADGMEDIIRKVKSSSIEDIERPKCLYCNEYAEFNTIQSAGYLEEGYAEQWKRYTDWIQGTLNKKVCIIELGVSMDYPTVIRWPFEKMAFYNQKSIFIRVNEKVPFMPEELREKGISVPENSINFLGN